MKKKYRNIVVGDTKYQWLYKRKYDGTEVLLFKIDVEYDLYSGINLEKRRYVTTFDIDSNIEIKPFVVRHLILNGKIDNRFIRKLKLRQLNAS